MIPFVIQTGAREPGTSEGKKSKKNVFSLTIYSGENYLGLPQSCFTSILKCPPSKQLLNCWRAIQREVHALEDSISIFSIFARILRLQFRMVRVYSR